LRHDSDPPGDDEHRAVLAFCGSGNNVTLVELVAAPSQPSLMAEAEGPQLRVQWRLEGAISHRGKKVFSSPILLGEWLLCASRDNSLYCYHLS
jgi:hypothetical protein